MPKKLEVGLKFTKSIVVDERLCVPHMAPIFGEFDSMPPVLATAYLVAFVEWTCLTGLRDYIEPGQRTVGTHINLSHTAATPMGLTVYAEAELVELNGKLMQLKIICRDDKQVISEGFHGRAIIDFEKFMNKLGQQ